ncbi:galectin-8 isoform X2 [Eucyclogobius newberryi]|uniref:galectin-8 isoform X2 n=1 Tax=Eucyclogobius newberryi TaxID=166745 RepID=UPI003B5B49CC
MSFSNPRQTFVKPMIPFSGTILGGLVPGEMLLIQGTLPSDADSFQVDLTCGSSARPRADVAFHFNPRVKKGVVVCNTLLKELWGPEEIHKVRPLKPGAAFELVILVQSDAYKVALNGAHLVQYKHRVELQRVDTLLIQGKVQVQAIAVLPKQNTDSSSEAQTLKPTESNNVPFRAEILKGLSPGRSITIRGRTTANAQYLVLDLLVGASSSIALHLNPRLKRRHFVRNSFLFDSWGPEERHLQDFPFSPAQYFEMIVQCDPGQFRVAVNGTHQFEYKHRVQDLSRITALDLSGDITLEEVCLL